MKAHSIHDLLDTPGLNADCSGQRPLPIMIPEEPEKVIKVQNTIC
jgi:hypothetical protein